MADHHPPSGGAHPPSGGASHDKGFNWKGWGTGLAVATVVIVGLAAVLNPLLHKGPAASDRNVQEMQTSAPLTTSNCPGMPLHADLHLGDEPTVISNGDCFVKWSTKGHVRLFDADGYFVDVGPNGGSFPGFWTVSAQAIDGDVRLNYMLTAS